MKKVTINYLTPTFKSNFAKLIFTHLPDLNQQSRNILIDNLNHPSNLFFERMLNHGICDKKQNFFIGLADRPNVIQRNSNHVEILTRTKTPGYYQEHSAFFNNATKFINPATNDVAPKDRVINSGICHYTYESDDTDLNEQLSWAIGEESVAKAIDSSFCRYRDYRGLTINWSGGKSLHIHLEFDIRHLSRSKFKSKNLPYTPGNDVPDEMLRDGLIRYWHTIRSEIVEIIKKKKGINVIFDNQLRFPESYRRLPWGIRYAGQNENFPLGTQIPQITVYERIRNRIGKKDGKGYFHEKEKFFDEFNRKKRSYQSSIKKLPTLHSNDERDFLEFLKDVLPAYLNSNYPEPTSVSIIDDDVHISFKNHKGDKKHSSILNGDFRTIKINGGDHNLPQEGYLLPYSANDLWRKFKDVYLDELFPVSKLPSIVTASAAKFGLMNNGKANVPGFLNDLLPTLLQLHPISVISTPEGAGKTRALLKGVSRLENHKGSIVVACASYAQAMAHCNDFNNMTKVTAELRGYRGIILPSLSHIYSGLNGRYSNTANIYEDGFGSQLEAIYVKEPHIAEIMEKRKAEILNQYPSEKLIFFTVHDVVQNWQNNMSTKVWLASNFAEEFNNRDNNKNWRENLNLLKFSYVIYDEIKRNDLRTQHPKAKVEWVKEIHRKAGKNPVELYKAYKQSRSKAPEPITLQEFLAIVNARYEEKHLVKLHNNIESIGRNTTLALYNVEGMETYVKETGWWSKSPGFNMIMLTTERGVLEYLNSINKKAQDSQGKANTQPPIPFHLYDLEPLMPLSPGTDITILRLDKQINTNVKKFVEDFMGKNKGWIVISNSCKGISDTVTHQTAKGQNVFAKLNLASTYMFPSKEQYAALIADGIYFNLKFPVRSYYRDEFNQSVGRNRGNRYTGKESLACMTPHFAIDFLPFFKKYARYQIRGY